MSLNLLSDPSLKRKSAREKSSPKRKKKKKKRNSLANNPHTQSINNPPPNQLPITPHTRRLYQNPHQPNPRRRPKRPNSAPPIPQIPRQKRSTRDSRRRSPRPDRLPRSGDFPGLEGRVEDAEVVLELWHAEETRPVVEVQAVGHAGEGGVEDCGEEGEGEFAGEVGAGFVEPVEDHFCLILILILILLFFFSFLFFLWDGGRGGWEV